MASLPYNADGKQVKAVVNGVTTYGVYPEPRRRVGNHYEVKNSVVTKYYFAGTTRLAVRTGGTLSFLLGDHLGSASITTDANGVKISEMRYKPWGEIRYSWTSGQSTTPAYTLPKFTFTGQRSYMDDPSTMEVEGFGLMDYNARMYDPAIGRFISADNIVPGVWDSQSWDRYAYGLNNPSRYRDPTGHSPVCGAANSDPECPPKPSEEPVRSSDSTWEEPPSSPDEDILNKVRELALGDETLILAWLWLYNTPTGNALALWIVTHGVSMRWDTKSEGDCENGVCAITISNALKPHSGPDVFDLNQEIQIQNELVATLGHEAHHVTVARPGTKSSKWEEAMAFNVYDQIYFELTGVDKRGIYSDLHATDEQSLNNWIFKYHPLYEDYHPYPGSP